MHDIKLIRDNRDLFVAALARRPAYAEEAAKSAAEILELDTKWREAKTSFEQHRARQNEASRAIGQAKAKKDEAGAKALLDEVASLKAAIQADQEHERQYDEQLRAKLAVLPNLPAADVPSGASENDNVEVAARRYGSATRLPFKAKEHFELGEALGMMDFERAGKVSGARFVYLKAGLARLERALGMFMLDVQTSNGYTEVTTPLLVREHAMYGTSQLPKFKEDLFVAASGSAVTTVKTTIAQAQAGETVDENMEAPFFLIPTAEVPLTNLVREDILEEGALPMRVTAWTPCFRAEAGAAGRDTRGMIRQHQFSKVELVSITTPEQSEAEHERMTDCAQDILKRLELPHRVVTLCTGDMGFSAQKTYDIEVWLPGQDRYREISSCSNCGEFQARRMNARYRPKDGKGTRFLHTLNGSGLAVGRTLIAVMENYQEADGSIRVPDALLPYMGGVTKISKP
ncbi:seryl-tRNA synthetase [Rhizomicrobium palustre]|uniref:Serine--tRNA ligase n=1 Tax=Rhizomicrobium palustre TaxID=189966 RepID=A0A846MUV0_9PROT|nr:serine--tRNA ligase [Rhizomicrobium palustre]NIK86971.1 seryl-tRNA synthetase [Rhizomicrobium palustre]